VTEHVLMKFGTERSSTAHGSLRLVGEGKYLTRVLLSRNSSAVLFFPQARRTRRR
jgi:hypothetical protein